MANPYLKNFLSSNLINSSKSPYTDLSAQQSDLINQIEKTIKHHESTTTLLTGLPGSGKTYLLNHCLRTPPI